MGAYVNKYIYILKRFVPTLSVEKIKKIISIGTKVVSWGRGTGINH